jgi:hypothetical protein
VGGPSGGCIRSNSILFQYMGMRDRQSERVQFTCQFVAPTDMKDRPVLGALEYVLCPSSIFDLTKLSVRTAKDLVVIEL